MKLEQSRALGYKSRVEHRTRAEQRRAIGQSKAQSTALEHSKALGYEPGAEQSTSSRLSSHSTWLRVRKFALGHKDTNFSCP
jgi:hypothetical protein